MQGSGEEEEADKIAKENKEKYENLCNNWKGMSDEELDSALEGISETLRGFFLRELSDIELKEILKRDTVLVHPLNVTTAIIVDSVEDIPSNAEEPDVKTYDKAYKYYLEITEGLSISDATARDWRNSGYFYFNFTGSENTSYNGTIKVNVANAPFSSANSNVVDSAKLSSVSFEGAVTGFALGTPYLIKQENQGVTNWTGIYLVGMQIGIPKYHKVDSVSAVNTEKVNYSRFGFYEYRDDAGGDDVSGKFVGKIKDENTTVSTYFQANAYNIGLDQAVGEYHAIMNVTYVRPTYKVTYHSRNHSDTPRTESSDCVKKTVSNLKYGSSYELISKPSNFTYKHYTFSHWTVGSSSTKRQPGDSITITTDRNVYANWTPNVYKITLDNQSATSAGSTAYYEKYAVNNYAESGCSTVISKITIPKKTGYTFGGYYTKKSGGGTQYVDEDGKITSKSNTFTKDTTLYAKWEANKYTVTIKYCRKDYASEAWSTISSTSKEVSYGSTLKLSPYVKSGYTIVNESITNNEINSYELNHAVHETSSGYVELYKDGTVSNITVVEDSTVCIYYFGSKVTPTPSPTPVPAYNLTVNPNGGTLVLPDGTSTTGTWSKEFVYGTWGYFCTGVVGYANESWDVCSLPEREECTFAGWSKSPSNAEIDQCYFNPWWDYHANLESDVTVTAQWNANLTYEYYTYDAADGTWVQMDLPEETYTQSVGTETSLTSVDSRAVAKTPEGYKISKYTVDSVDGAELSTVSSNGVFKIQKNTTICICYMPMDLNLTIDVKGGTYYTAAGLEDEDFGTTFTYGVEREFSSKDINTWVTGGMSLPTKVGYHLCDPTNEIDVEYAEKHGLSTEPWVLKNNATGSVIDSDTYGYDGMSTVDVTIEANWIPNTVTLYINPNGGQLYGFDYNTDTDIETAVLKWSSKIFSKRYTMGETYYFASTGGYTLDTNASVCFASSHLGYGKADDGVLDIPYRYGYVFNGWTSNSDTGVITEATEGCVRSWAFKDSSDNTSDIYVTAQWTPNTHTITVDPNGGKFYTPDSQSTMVSSTWSKSFTVGSATCYAHDYEGACDTNLKAVSQPIRTGYTFAGWKQTVGGGSTYVESIYNFFNSDYDGDVTFTAQWTPNTYILTVDPNGGSMYNGENLVSSSFTTNAVYGRKTYLGNLNSGGGYYSNYGLGYPKKTGYTFSHWTFDHGTGGTITDGSLIYFSDKANCTTKTEYAYNGDYAGNVTATAQYRIHQSTLHVNPNGGTWKDSKNTQSFTQNYNTTLAIPDPTKPNYTATFNANGGTCSLASTKTNVAFSSWDTSSIGTAGTLNTSTKVFTFGPTDNGEGTIKALWNGSYKITLPTPTRPGWDFVGWYTAATGGTEVGNAGTTVTLSSDKTYYAHWVVHPTKITLSNTVDKSKVAFVKGNPVAVFKVTGKDVSGVSHTYIKTLKWDTTSNNYQSLSFTILSGTYTVTLLNQNEYTVGTPSGSSNVTASGTTASVNMSDGSEGTVNYASNETDYSKYTGNSLVVTSLK